MNFDLSKCKNILIVGAGHGIGLAMVKQVLDNFPHINLFATYRLESRATELLEFKKIFPNQLELLEIDPTNESAITDMAIDFVSRDLKFNMIINTVGVLHDTGISPEKSIRSFNVNNYLEIMKINTIITPLLAKHFERLLDKDNISAFVSLSAKVGSIDDNKMGGWYSYRASKAALNMMVKNISIEFSRKRNDCIVLAIHPGTTKTGLSKPYLANTSCKIHSPEQTAKNIFNVLQNQTLTDSGKFLSWDGTEILW